MIECELIDDKSWLGHLYKSEDQTPILNPRLGFFFIANDARSRLSKSQILRFDPDSAPPLVITDRSLAAFRWSRI